MRRSGSSAREGPDVTKLEGPSYQIRRATRLRTEEAGIVDGDESGGRP